ncbi:MAG: FAD:protein FMN transferase [Candidatus Wallbacteria bacterium]|nr:FAD:protein FMN transferase [Candidatus Wallbacteria bacterium]
MRAVLATVLLLTHCVTAAAGTATVAATRQAMGTLLEVTAVASNRRVAEAAVEAAFAEAARLDGVLSDWRGTTELSAFNRAAGTGPRPVSNDLLAVLRMSAAVHAASGGAFDVTVGPVVLALRRGDRAAAFSPGTRALVDGAGLEVRGGSASLAHSGMACDLGGIGKGYAADRMREAMLRAGAGAGYIDFGRSTMVGFGPRCWRVLLCGLDGRIGPVIELRDCSLSTSRTGDPGCDTVDPRTCLPVPFRRIVTLRARSAGLADAWTKPPGVLGRLGLDLLVSSGLPCDVWYQDAAGAVELHQPRSSPGRR